MKGKTVFITGSSRGIGKAIAVKMGQMGANVVIAAKTVTPHPKLEGTIHTAAAEVEAVGGRALAIQLDIRDDEKAKAALETAVDHFGGIDILINNASAINLTSAEYMPMKRYDLIHDINVRGTYMMSKLCIPYLKKGNNPHILNLSPPINLDKKWFGNHLAYTMSKYGMSMVVLGLAEELKEYKIAANALWPRTAVATAAVKYIAGESMMKSSRKPEIMADAAAVILNRPSDICTGNFYIDDEVLAEAGITDFDQYAIDPSEELTPDLFL